MMLGLTLIAGRGGEGQMKASSTPRLSCQLKAQAEYAGRGEVTVRFTLRNETDTPVAVLRWYTPLEGLKGDIFKISKRGRAIAYQGPLFKRGDPTREDYVVLPPRESVSATVDLAKGYDLSRPGTYSVRFTAGLSDVAPEGAIPRPQDKHQGTDLKCGPVTLTVRP
jgi:hypothetical protein